MIGEVAGGAALTISGIELLALYHQILGSKTRGVSA
jgi:hypothetical protein